MESRLEGLSHSQENAQRPFAKMANFPQQTEYQRLMVINLSVNYLNVIYKMPRTITDILE